MLSHAHELRSGEASPTLRLCRIDVSPCQHEINLAPGEETTLALIVRLPDSTTSVLSQQSLAAWYVRLIVEGDDAVVFPDVVVTGRPFQERTLPQLALRDLVRLGEDVQADPSAGRYLQVTNSYAPHNRRLEYGIALVGAGARSAGEDRLGQAGAIDVVLGALTVRGTATGNARLVPDSAGPTPSTLVTLDDFGELRSFYPDTWNAAAKINVGPNAERARLEGQAWSDVPESMDSYRPFTGPVRVEFWKQGAVPAWEGGADAPLATFSNIQPRADGSFIISDLPVQLVPDGVHDLRASGPGTLSYLLSNVVVETNKGLSGSFPTIVEATFGPLGSGDLNGDNQVNDADLSTFRSSFGQEIAAGETSSLGDFNADGLVDGLDFSLMAANYGRKGQ